MAKKKTTNKKQSARTLFSGQWKGGGWIVVNGQLKAGRGRPRKAAPILTVVAEKIPFDALSHVRKDMEAHGYSTDGVYFAHDSMGVARYGGRGQIFKRLASHKKKYPRELEYFSFYIIEEKNHEREIETAILRAAGPQMILNTRKVQNGIVKGDVRDYEPGTEF